MLVSGVFCWTFWKHGKKFVFNIQMSSLAEIISYDFFDNLLDKEQES